MLTSRDANGQYRSPVRPGHAGWRRATRASVRCPSCGDELRDQARHRQDLAMTWLYSDPLHPGRVLERRHCVGCQPHEQVAGIECALCAAGPILAGELAALTARGPVPGLADPVRVWLAEHGWRELRGLGLVCARHRQIR